MFNLIKKNILITGAGGLLGSEFVGSIINAGATCYAVDIDNKKLKRLKKKFVDIDQSNRLHLLNFDISNTKQVTYFYNRLKKKNIFVDVIINNAAFNPAPSPKKIDNWDNDIKISLTSVKNIIEKFSLDMIKNKKGNIINIGSDLSIIAPDQKLYSHIKNYIKPLSYSVTKHGIVGLTKYYASLFGKYNIRCNCLCPGGVKNKQDKNFIKKISRLIPIGRMANKDEYNGIIVFLCSDASKFITGQNIIADGGRSIL
jgi:NAD(P)-dependent dehydrogenase (short-subunit alcohol dehydrogenase family)